MSTIDTKKAEDLDHMPQGERATDTQVGGSHYQGAIQPIDFIVKNDIPYREGNAIKYIYRHRNKNGVEDLKKAIHYLQMIIDDYEADNAQA